MESVTALKGNNAQTGYPCITCKDGVSATRGEQFISSIIISPSCQISETCETIVENNNVRIATMC